jgi:hypothetical protein
LEPYVAHRQESVTVQWISGLANPIEQEKGGHDDVRPATQRLGQYHGQDNHPDWRQHQGRDPQASILAEIKVGRRHFHVATVDAQDIAQKAGSRDDHPGCG